MKKSNAIEYLAVGMAALSTKQLRNLKHHLEKQTPIICGEKADLFTSATGCGCPATLASRRRFKKVDAEFGFELPTSVWETWTTLDEASGRKFRSALKSVRQDDVREAITKALELRGI